MSCRHPAKPGSKKQQQRKKTNKKTDKLWAYQKSLLNCIFWGGHRLWQFHKLFPVHCCVASAQIPRIYQAESQLRFTGISPGNNDQREPSHFTRWKSSQQEDVTRRVASETYLEFERLHVVGTGGEVGVDPSAATEWPVVRVLLQPHAVPLAIAAVQALSVAIWCPQDQSHQHIHHQESALLGSRCANSGRLISDTCVQIRRVDFDSTEKLTIMDDFCSLMLPLKMQILLKLTDIRIYTKTGCCNNILGLANWASKLKYSPSEATNSN